MEMTKFLENEFKEAETMLKDNLVKDVRVNFFLPARLLQFIRTEDVYDEKMDVTRSTRQDSVNLYFDEECNLEQITYKKQFNDVGRGDAVTADTIPASKTLDGKDSTSLRDVISDFLKDKDYTLENDAEEEISR